MVNLNTPAEMRASEGVEQPVNAHNEVEMTTVQAQPVTVQSNVQPAQAQPVQPVQVQSAPMAAPAPAVQAPQPIQHNVISSRSATFARQLRKGQETWPAVIKGIEPAMIYAKDADGEFVLDRYGRKQQLVIDGKPQFSENRFKVVVLDTTDSVERILWVLKSQFLNGAVPTIPGIAGLPAQITTYLDDDDRPQVAQVAYDLADTKVVSSDLKKLIASGAVKMEF